MLLYAHHALLVVINQIMVHLSAHFVQTVPFQLLLEPTNALNALLAVLAPMEQLLETISVYQVLSPVKDLPAVPLAHLVNMPL